MKADKETQNFVRSLVEKIKKSYKPKKIILYGSYAYGKPTRDSDIDLLIVKETKERPIDRRVRVRKIVDIRKPISFSPLVVTPKELKFRLKAGDQFLKEIMSRGEVLYAE